MVRAYAVQGLKKRKKDEQENYTRPPLKQKRDPEEEPVEEEEEQNEAEQEEEEEEESKKPGVIFILERASLEVKQVGKTDQLLNSDDHVNFLQRQDKDPADYRPDITHQALLAILDSPVTKAHRLKALYVKTEKGDLIKVKPHVRMPRTIKRFYGLMLQLIKKRRITVPDKNERLLEFVKNPVTQYLPANSRIIGLSHSSTKLFPLQKYLSAVSDDTTLVFVVGSMAHGKIKADYTDDLISVSNYPLSAACCINRICEALEMKWNIL